MEKEENKMPETDNNLVEETTSKDEQKVEKREETKEENTKKRKEKTEKKKQEKVVKKDKVTKPKEEKTSPKVEENRLGKITETIERKKEAEENNTNLIEKENKMEEIQTTEKENAEQEEKIETISAQSWNEINEVISSEENQNKVEDKTPKEPQQFTKVETKPKKSRKGFIALITMLVIIIVALVFSIIFAIINMSNTKILKGISVLGIDISDLTIDEAKQKINEAIAQKFTNEKESIVLKRGDSEVSVNANTFNAKFDVDTAVAKAYNIGRSGNIIVNNYTILWTKLFPIEIEAEFHFDEEFMNNTINDINSKMKDAVVEYSYYIEGEKLIVVKGKSGYQIKKEELQNKIVEQLKNIHNPYQEIELPVEKREPSSVDLEKIKSEIYKEPKDAYVEKNPTKVHVEEDGVDFGISIEEAKKLLQEEKEEYEIPLKITKAKKKLSDLGEEAFPDELATFSTIYDASAVNRAANIELAAKKINGTVIMPGETFSYNKIVGSRTIEAGWKEGTAYISGKVVPSVGGGVCQVSSTLYNTALLANLDITERTNHTFTVDYVAASRDATVYYGSLDFCFKNSRTYPIKVVASAKNGVCKVSLQGIKEEKEYEVIIQSKITGYINNTVTYKEDPTLPEGKEVVEQAGFNGCRSEGYKILKLNGKVVSQTLLSKDTYSPQERIVRRGTKKVTTTTTGE